MTWRSFFDLGTLESRHLLASYAFVFLVQGGYFAWLVRGWARSRPR